MSSWGRAKLGFAVWLAAAAYFVAHDRFIGVLRAALALALLVIVPLGLGHVHAPDRTGHVPGRAWELPAGLAAVASLALPFGWIAGALGLPWLAVTVLAALQGLRRALQRPHALPEERCIDAALVYLPIGGVWLCAWSSGRTLLGFDGVIVILTAIHFHYAGFAAPLVAGLAGRCLRVRGARWQLYRGAAWLVIAGPPLIAVGIAASPLVELLFALLLALGMLVLGALLGAVIGPRSPRLEVRLLLALAGLSLVLTMALACLYALGEWSNRTLVAIDTMALTHGIANSVGFALPALVALTMLAPPSRAPRSGLPLSRLMARGRVGADFFEPFLDRGTPQGLVDDMAVFARDGFDPSAVDPRVRDFYERTAHYRLYVVPRWRSGFRTGARLFRALARRLGQLGLPLDPVSDEQMLGRIDKLDDGADGRRGVRSWLRTYVTSGEVVYAAAYAVHEEAGVPYMNIAFPLPFSNMTSVLRVDHAAEREGLVLTTLPGGNRSGDQGIYLVTRWLYLRLPFDETITVRRRGGGDEAPAAATVLARHDMWLFGIRFLTLSYALVPRE